MPTCNLCRRDTDPGDLARVSGLDFCIHCRQKDPAEALSAHDIAVEWSTRLMRFNAGIGIDQQDPDLSLKCTPELWYHKLFSVLRSDLKIGDPQFDQAIWIATNKPEQARRILAHEGVQSAILAMLSGVRVNELVGNHVRLDGPTLRISTRPLGGLPEAKIQELKLEAAALALHLRHRS